MNTSDWISRNVSKLLPTTNSKGNKALAGKFIQVTATKLEAASEGITLSSKAVAPVVHGAAGQVAPRPAWRSTRERLAGTLRRSGEALSPRELRRFDLGQAEVLAASSSSVKENVVPCPTTDSAQMRPPCRLMMRCTVASPMPEPANCASLCSRWKAQNSNSD